MGDPFAKPNRASTIGPVVQRRLGAVNRKTTDEVAKATVIAEIKNSKIFKVVVKPGSSKNEVLGYSEDKKAYVIDIKAAAEKGKANTELLNFLRKATGKRFVIKNGIRSREKTLIATSS